MKETIETASFVKSALSYDPNTGLFRWYERPVEMFSPRMVRAEREAKRWNTRFAGKIAGSKNLQGYISICVLARVYPAHRIAWVLMTGEWPRDEIDHINLDRADNRWVNLRKATPSQNRGNRRLQPNNASGFKGVRWDKRYCKWEARIQKDGVHHFLGCFEQPEAAHEAYLSAAKRLYGEFARGE
jgi:hypothetical protein